MAALLGPTNESGIVYYLYGSNGARVVFNDPTDPDYVGPLSGDDGITGLDFAEIIESSAQKTEDDGATHGNFYLGRRPITMTGAIVPTSSLDRATRLHKLKSVLSSILRNDGTLYFTPTGGEQVYVNVRAQQPPRFRGKWTKEFFVSLVAADPRFYSTKRKTAYFENGSSASPTFRRFTWASGTGTSLATRNVYLPAGTWTMRTWVKRSTAAGTLAAAITPNSALSSTPASLTTGWTELTQTVTTTNPEGSATTVALNLGAALTAGQWIEIGPTVFESAAGLAPSDAATFATNWTAGAGYTASHVTASPPTGIENQGNTVAPPRGRLVGPGTNVVATYGKTVTGGVAAFQLVGATYAGSDYVVVDVNNKTAIKNGSTNDYASVLASANVFYGGLPAGFFMPTFHVASGGSTATRLETTWRNTYL